MFSGFYELQRLPFTQDGKIADLYHRFSGSSSSLPAIGADLRSIHLPKDCELNLNTYFGSFYETYWQQYTRVTDIHLSFRLQGEIQLRLYRHAASTEELIHQRDIRGSSEEISIAVNMQRNGLPSQGRIYARFFSQADNTTLSDLAWQTPQAPPNLVDLSIVVCTYNRDEYLANVLEQLAPLQKKKMIGQVHVVNQGQAGLQKRVRHNMNVIFYEQENFGGSGGFARGMIEVMNRSGDGQVLLMDDDIVIDPEVVRRLPQLLGYIKDDVAVGGHMLDSLAPKKLMEAGGRFNPQRLVVNSVAEGIDICSENGLSHFANIDRISHNGWWFFAFPAKELSRVGLPLPFFIKCDDVEYGMRLMHADVTTVSWPGLAVWHEPFYAKSSYLTLYYVTRNSMFISKYHGIFRKMGVLKTLSSIFSSSLMQFSYHRAWAIVRAMEDFLKGPDVLAQWSAAEHRQLMDEGRQWSEPDIPRSTSLPQATLTGRAPRWRWLEGSAALWRILSDMLRPVNADAPLKGVDYWNGWNIWCAAGQDNLAVTHDFAGVYHVHKRDPKKIRPLFMRFCKAYLAIACGLAKKHDKAAMDRLTRESFWRDRLGVPKP